jgi:hypothetical protein
MRRGIMNNFLNTDIVELETVMRYYTSYFEKDYQVLIDDKGAKWKRRFDSNLKKHGEWFLEEKP